jgi:hypothetical protein
VRPGSDVILREAHCEPPGHCAVYPFPGPPVRFGRSMSSQRLQHFLGHASITNTVRYTAMSPEPFKDIWR